MQHGVFVSSTFADLKDHRAACKTPFVNWVLSTFRWSISALAMHDPERSVFASFQRSPSLLLESMRAADERVAVARASPI
jgi:hypothetical protein